MSQLIKVQGYVENSDAMAAHEVWDMVANLIDQFRQAGFSDDDIMDGLELAMEEEF